MAELANSMAELPKEKTRVYVQIKPIPLKNLEKKKTPRATFYTQLEIKIQQPPQEKGMSIKELVAKLINKGKNMVEISFEGQHDNFPSILKVK